MYVLRKALLFLCLVIVFQIISSTSFAQVQVIKQFLEQEETHAYLLSDLKEGDTIYLQGERLSGNLEPWIGLAFMI